MVHALKQAWRVLKTHGILVDLRPRHTSMLIEIMHDTGTEIAGCYDDAHRENNDSASDNAIKACVDAGHFERVRTTHFDYVNQFDSGHELLERSATRNPPIIFPDKIVEAIQLITLDNPAVIHDTASMQLDCYRKLG